MFSYEELKHKPKTLRAMTSLNLPEFDELLPAFVLEGERPQGLG